MEYRKELIGRGFIFDTIAAGGRGGARGGAGGRGTVRISMDSLSMYHLKVLKTVRPDSGFARVAGGRGGSATDNVTPGAYLSGWSGSRNGGHVNQAAGLRDHGSSESGISGLLSASVSSTEKYTYPAGDLAPQLLRILVVHLAPGTSWTGR
jgi:hypothetical protein